MRLPAFLLAALLLPTAAMAGEKFDGPYVALAAGYQATSLDIISGDGEHGSLRGGSFAAGGAAGWQFRLDDDWVLGVEGALALTTDMIHHADIEVGRTVTGAVTVRPGYVVAPDTMVYALAGVGVGRFHQSGDYGGNPQSVSSTELGFVVGGGIESYVADDVSLRVEYQHIEWGDFATVNGGQISPRDDRISLGVTIHF